MDDSPQTATTNKIALLVAPRYKGLSELKALPGTAHDLKVMRDITGKLQFDKVVELEGDNATKHNILKILRSLDDLSSNATSETIALFYFAGHGYYLPLTKDEGLVPADATEQKLKDDAVDTCITGRDLLPFLERFARKKVKLTVIFDCCHSGQLYRVVQLKNSDCTDLIPRQVIFEETLDSAKSPTTSNAEEPVNKLLRGGWTPGEKDTFFFIAACSPVQLAYELINGGGRLTTAIKTVFDSIQSYENPVSINAFFRLIEREFKRKGWYQLQTPQLEGANFYTELFGAQTCQEPFRSPGITVKEVKGDQVILNAGCLQNLLAGRYHVFETTVSGDTAVDKGKACSDWLGSIDVTEGGIGPIEASCLIVEPHPDKKIQSGCLAFLKTPSTYKTNAWIRTTSEVSVDDENVRNLLNQIKQTNIVNVSTSEPLEDIVDLIIIDVELHGSSNQNQCWVARREGNIIVPPLSLGLEGDMANNLNRYLRHQFALASAQSPKGDDERLKNVSFKVLKIEKVKPFNKENKEERIKEGLECGEDLYQDPSKCPELLSHSLNGDPEMNKIEDNTGDAFLFQVTNLNKDEEDTIHVCVLFFQFDGAIKVIYPPGKASTKELRGNDTAEDIFRVFIPFNSLRKMAEPDTSKPEPDRGVDTIVVYATSKPADFESLVQTAIVTDPNLIARGKEEKPKPLSKLAEFLLPIKKRCLEDHPDDKAFKWFVEKKEFAVVKKTNN